MATTETAVARIAESGDPAAIGAFGWMIVALESIHEGEIEDASEAISIAEWCLEHVDDPELFHDLATAERSRGNP